MAVRTRCVRGTVTSPSSTDDALRYTDTEPSGRSDRNQRPSTLTGRASGGAPPRPPARVYTLTSHPSPLPAVTRKLDAPSALTRGEIAGDARFLAVDDAPVADLAAPAVRRAPRNSGDEAEDQRQKPGPGTAQ